MPIKYISTAGLTCVTSPEGIICKPKRSKNRSKTARRRRKRAAGPKAIKLGRVGKKRSRKGGKKRRRKGGKRRRKHNIVATL